MGPGRMLEVSGVHPPRRAPLDRPRCHVPRAPLVPDRRPALLEPDGRPAPFRPHVPERGRSASRPLVPANLDRGPLVPS